MHIAYMERAIELAEKGRGRTSPNPLVGAVIVQSNKIVGEGFHKEVGGPHAEINALRIAKEKAKDATMYVTLEPCCFYGRTPPCTEALKESGIKEVIIGLRDPNPKVCGKGAEELSAAGIRVQMGVESETIAAQNEVYIKYVTTGIPFVTLKAAMSLNGRIALHKGERTCISGDISQEQVHSLRDGYDAVAVGIGTVLVDDPLLTSRTSGKRPHNPVRIIVDSALSIPLDSQIVQTASKVKTIVACASAASGRKKLLQEKGIEVIDLPGNDGRVDLEALLKEAAKKGIASVLWEGGAKLNASLVNAELVDKFLLFFAPVLFGDNNAPGLIEADAGLMQEVYKLEVAGVRKSGGDVVVEAYPVNRPLRLQ